jgi:hypothetical protein
MVGLLQNFQILPVAAEILTVSNTRILTETGCDGCANHALSLRLAQKNRKIVAGVG